MRLTPLPTPTITGPSNAGGISLQPVLGRGPQGPQGLPGVGSAAWTAATAVSIGTVRQAPDGSWIKSTAARTTGATFDSTEQTFWTATLATAGTLEASALSATIADIVVAAITTVGSAIWTAFASIFGLRKGVDPREFGAVGNGTTDDTVAFRAAVAAAGPGGLVKIPHKFTILVRPAAGAPFDNSGVEIRGSAWGGSVIKCDRDVTVFRDVYGSGTCLRNFTFDNHKTGVRTYPDFEFINPNRPVIDNVKVTRAGNPPPSTATATGAPSIVFRKDSALAGATAGFMPTISKLWLADGWMLIDGVTDGKMSDSFVWATWTGADGAIELRGVAGWTFTACDVVPPAGGDGAAYLFSTSISYNNAIIGGYVDGSYAENMTGNGLKSTAPVRGLRVVGVGFYNLGRSAIKTTGMSHCTIQACMFSQCNKADNFYPDVELTDAVGNTFIGNIHRAPDVRTNRAYVYVEYGVTGDNLYADMTMEKDPSIVPNGHYYGDNHFYLTDSALIRNPRPNSAWRFSTSKSIAAPYTVTTYDIFQARMLLVSGGSAITLPSASSAHTGDSVRLKNTSTTQNVAITPNGAQTIDGAATWTLLPLQSVRLLTDGSNWVVEGNDSTVVHKAGAETIAGVKTFTSAPVVPDGSFAEAKVTGLVADLAAKAIDTAVVHTAGTETVTGAKTFSAGATVTGTRLTVGNGLALLGTSRTTAATLTTASPTNNDCDGTSGAFTVTLPATTVDGIEFRIKKNDSSGNAITVAPPASGNIDGASTISLAAQWDAITVRSTTTSGTWRIVSRYKASLGW